MRLRQGSILIRPDEYPLKTSDLSKMKRKRRSINQIREEISFQVLREKLPQAWVIHEYGPDYGIDLVIELFDYLDETKSMAETLGENIFVQLKSSSSVEYGTRRVHPRANVEKALLKEEKSEYYDIPVAKCQLEMPELLTVQSMGPAIPVLLVLVDVNTRRAFFVCLNDYLDKVIIPEDPTYSDKDSKTIFIPLANEILSQEENLVPLRAYGKRSKMYGAFGKIMYQYREIARFLGFATYTPEQSEDAALEMLRVFTEASLRQDIWHGHDFWAPVGDMFLQLQDVRTSLEGGIAPREARLFVEYCHDVWRRLANLANMYEELVREWFMPTFLAQMMSYPTSPEPFTHID